MFTKALACAALLMGAPVPDAPVSFVTISPASMAGMCRLSPNCGAQFYVSDGRMHVTTGYPNDWKLMVHEGCHAVQASQGHPWNGRVAERECYRIAARADQCRFTPGR